MLLLFQKKELRLATMDRVNLIRYFSAILTLLPAGAVRVRARHHTYRPLDVILEAILHGWHLARRIGRWVARSLPIQINTGTRRALRAAAQYGPRRGGGYRVAVVVRLLANPLTELRSGHLGYV